MHDFLFSLPFPAPTHLKAYKYLNKVLNSSLQGRSNASIECSNEQLEDAKAIDFNSDVIQREIEEAEIHECYRNKFETFFG